MLLAPCFGSAQAPADACALMGRDAFQALTGKTEYTDPTGMPWGGGTGMRPPSGTNNLWANGLD